MLEKAIMRSANIDDLKSIRNYILKCCLQNNNATILLKYIEDKIKALTNK